MSVHDMFGLSTKKTHIDLEKYINIRFNKVKYVIFLDFFCVVESEQPLKIHILLYQSIT